MSDDPLEARLAALGRSPADPVEGLYGPASMSWEVVRETALLVGGGRALLLQLAHPAIAAAVAHHSTFNEEPLRRSVATAEALHTVVFGDRAAALAMARRVGRRHADVHGRYEGGAYTAADPTLGWWVLATLFDTTLLTFQALVRPLSPDEAARLYAESFVTAAAFGVPPEELPRDLAAFHARFDATLATLVPSDEARRQVAHLRSHVPAFLGQGAGAVGQAWLAEVVFARRTSRAAARFNFDWLTAGLLPPNLREAYDLPWGRGAGRLHAAALRTLGRLYRRLPPETRYHDAWHDAARRVRGPSA